MMSKRNVGFYYYDQVKVSIPYFYYFWVNLLLNRVKHNKNSGLFDLSLSVCKRFEQVYFTYDLICDIIKNAKNIENPGTFFDFYYHFTQFISLIKSIGDNLAWILNLKFLKYLVKRLTNNLYAFLKDRDCIYIDWTS